LVFILKKIPFNSASLAIVEFGLHFIISSVVFVFICFYLATYHAIYSAIYLAIWHFILRFTKMKNMISLLLSAVLLLLCAFIMAGCTDKTTESPNAASDNVYNDMRMGSKGLHLFY